jgi:hypothetical protein
MDFHLQSFCYPSQAHRSICLRVLRQAHFARFYFVAQGQFFPSRAHFFESGFCPCLLGDGGKI